MCTVFPTSLPSLLLLPSFSLPPLLSLSLPPLLSLSLPLLKDDKSSGDIQVIGGDNLEKLRGKVDYQYSENMYIIFNSAFSIHVTLFPPFLSLLSQNVLIVEVSIILVESSHHPIPVGIQLFRCSLPPIFRISLTRETRCVNCYHCWRSISQLTSEWQGN